MRRASTNFSPAPAPCHGPSVGHTLVAYIGSEKRFCEPRQLQLPAFIGSPILNLAARVRRHSPYRVDAKKRRRRCGGCSSRLRLRAPVFVLVARYRRRLFAVLCNPEIGRKTSPSPQMLETRTEHAYPISSSFAWLPANS